MQLFLKKATILFYLFLPLLLGAQNNPDPLFIQHLVGKKMYSEVIFLLEDLEGASSAQTDSLHYFKGWSLYSLKSLGPSADQLLRVSPASPFYVKSRFFAAYNQTHLGNYQPAKEILLRLNAGDREAENLRLFQLAGISLLEKNYVAFENLAGRLDTSHYVLHDELLTLNSCANRLKSHRQKSPAVAGVFSALVPGAGKIYAGKTAQGISTLITVVGFGLVTLENWKKNGPENFKTILFGSVFTTFYIGNIYGSVYAARISENEFQHEYQNRILFNLHIPLRNFFN